MIFRLIALMTLLAACNPIRTDTEAILWLSEPFANRPVDFVYADWGLPDRESYRNDGATIREYRHHVTEPATYTNDPKARKYTRTCYAHFISLPDSNNVDEIQLNGSPSACHDLAWMGRPSTYEESLRQW